MPVSTVYVYHSSGSPAQGASVTLSFSHSGVSPSSRTDRDGKAIVDHTATGEATVIVDGTTVGSMRAPGTFTVTK